MEQMVNILKTLFNTIYQNADHMSDWRIAIVIPIPKNHNKIIIEISENRQISNSSNVSKIFEKILLNRLKKIKIEKCATSISQI